MPNNELSYKDYPDGTKAYFRDDTAREQIATVDSRVSAFTLGAPINISSYSTSSNRYTCPSDGYLRLVVNGGGSGWVMVNGQSTISSTGSSSGNVVALCMPVKKGITVLLFGGSQQNFKSRTQWRILSKFIIFARIGRQPC